MGFRCNECGNILENPELKRCLDCRKKAQENSGHAYSRLPPSAPPRLVRDLKRNHGKTKIKPQPGQCWTEMGLFLYGPAGVGKSYEALAVMLRVVQLDRRAIWMNVPELLYSIRTSFNDPDKGERLVEQLSRIPWLCLDDLGAEKTTDWSLQTLYLIINKRYENERTTVITSNLSLDELREKMEDDRLSSRIAGMCLDIHMTGEDKRLEAHHG